MLFLTPNKPPYCGSSVVPYCFVKKVDSLTCWLCSSGWIPALSVASESATNSYLVQNGRPSFVPMFLKQTGSLNITAIKPPPSRHHRDCSTSVWTPGWPCPAFNEPAAVLLPIWFISSHHLLVEPIYRVKQLQYTVPLLPTAPEPANTADHQPLSRRADQRKKKKPSWPCFASWAHISS